MKKRHYIFLLMILSLVSTHSFAQMPIDKGTAFVNAGIGVGTYGLGTFGGYGFNSGLAIGASAEFGVYKNITVGGFADYRRVGYVGVPGGTNYIYLGARGSYHFNELLKLPMNNLDLYAGLGIGYLVATLDRTYYGGYSAGGVIVPVHIGGRYFFSDNVGGFAELATDVAPLKLGVTFKLK